MKCIYESKIERFYQVPIKSFKALVKLMGDLTALGWLARAARKSPQQAARALSRTVPLPRPSAHFSPMHTMVGKGPAILQLTLTPAGPFETPSWLAI